jgi:flagellar hook-associated protein 1 FlgK
MSTEEDVMLQIEDAVSGLSDQGIRAEFDALWNAFDDLASLPEDLGGRRVTLERAEAVGRSLRSAAKSLNTLHLTQMATAEVQVSRINELANSIAALDRQIIGGAASGAAPNGLIDQRDLMVGEMASLIDVSAVPESDGQISITIDGFLVVRVQCFMV